jgi:hypothetical protein
MYDMTNRAEEPSPLAEKLTVLTEKRSRGSKRLAPQRPCRAWLTTWHFSNIQ